MMKRSFLFCLLSLSISLHAQFAVAPVLADPNDNQHHLFIKEEHIWLGGGEFNFEPE